MKKSKNKKTKLQAGDNPLSGCEDNGKGAWEKSKMVIFYILIWVRAY